MTEKRNVMLDILRILAMLMVLMVHIPIYLRLPYTFPGGQYGVAIFFVLSGYLIMDSLNRNPDVGLFYKKRLLRILPEYYMILLIGFLVWDGILGKMPDDTLLHMGWLRYVLCLNTVLPSNDYFYWNDLWGLWTISCFMFFYLAAPLFKKFIHSFRQSVVAVIAAILAGYGFKLILGRGLMYAGIENAQMFAGDTPFFNLMIYMIGVCAWFAVQEKKENIYLLLCLTVVFVFVFIGKTNRIEWGAIAGLALIAGQGIEFKNSAVVSIVKAVSKYSFTIYLVHFPVFQILGEIMGGNGNQIAFAVLSFLCIAAGSWLIHNTADSFMRFIMKKTRRA